MGKAMNKLKKLRQQEWQKIRKVTHDQNVESKEVFCVSEINQSPRKIQLAKFLSQRSYFKKLWNVARGRVKFLDWTLKTCCESGHIPMNTEWSAHKDLSKTNWLLKEWSSVTKKPMNSFVEILIALLVVETCCDPMFWETTGDIYESKQNRHCCKYHT